MPSDRYEPDSDHFNLYHDHIPDEGDVCLLCHDHRPLLGWRAGRRCPGHRDDPARPSTGDHLPGYALPATQHPAVSWLVFLLTFVAAIVCVFAGIGFLHSLHLLFGK